MWSTSTSAQQSTATGCFLVLLSVPVINWHLLALLKRSSANKAKLCVYFILYFYIHYPLAAFTNWIYFHLTSTVIKTQSQLSMASWDEGNPNCSRLTCFPEPTVTLAAEDMSNYAAFSSTVLLGFFPFNLLPLRFALVLIYWSSFSCVGWILLRLFLLLTNWLRCVARAITNCTWYQTQRPAAMIVFDRR